MKILVLAPLKVEYDNFKNALASCSNLKHSYKVVECGVGKANAASTAALELCTWDQKFDLCVVIGYAAGGLNLQQGSVVIPKEVRYHDTFIIEGIADELLKLYPLCGMDDYTILTGDCFVSPELATSLSSRFGSHDLVFDMESAAVAQICDDLNVPCFVIKLISDIPQRNHNETTFLDFVNENKDFNAFVRFIETL